MRVVADDDRVGLGKGLQTRRLVGGGALDVITVQGDEVGVHRHPQLQRNLIVDPQALRSVANRTDHLQGAEHGAARIVLVDLGVAEAHEQAVALTVLDVATEPFDDRCARGCGSRAGCR